MNDINETAIKILNEALQADPEAIRALFSVRVECNEALANHPTIQVGAEPPNVALLGIINGIIEPLTGRRICGIYDGKLLRFDHYKEPAKTI